jgi:hypothetical protein
MRGRHCLRRPRARRTRRPRSRRAHPARPDATRAERDGWMRRVCSSIPQRGPSGRVLRCEPNPHVMRGTCDGAAGPGGPGKDYTAGRALHGIGGREHRRVRESGCGAAAQVASPPATAELSSARTGWTDGRRCAPPPRCRVHVATGHSTVHACARRDSNPHTRRHWNLNPARLPIPPLARAVQPTGPATDRPRHRPAPPHSTISGAYHTQAPRRAVPHLPAPDHHALSTWHVPGRVWRIRSPGTCTGGSHGSGPAGPVPSVASRT